MANAIFNISPVRFLSSFQDNVETITNTAQKKRNDSQGSSSNDNCFNHVSNSNSNNDSVTVTLQLTLPDDDTSNINMQPQESTPIDIPRSIPLNIPNNNNHLSYDGLMINDNYLSTSVNSNHSSLFEQDISLIQMASSYSNPYMLNDDLSSFFDNLAVNSPSSPFQYPNGQYQQPMYQQINSPVNIGSPQSPSFINQYNNNGSVSPTPSNIVIGSPYNLGSPLFPASTTHSPTFNSSPISTHFINSPAINITNEEINNGYLSPTMTQQISSSPTLSLFPPNIMPSRSTTPVPEDVILTTSELNEYFKATSTSTKLTINTDANFLSSPTKIKKSTVKLTTPSGRKAKVHKCPYCEHTSNRANNMKEHIQIHDPHRPKPHECKICNRPFARKHDMNRHYMSCKKNKLKYTED